MKHLYTLLTAVLCLCISAVQAQTNPTPYVLAAGDYSFDGFLDGESTTYPESMQGWSFIAEATEGFVGPATADRALATIGTTATSGSIKNEGAEGISFLNSGSNNIGALAFAINTVGIPNCFISWKAEDIRAGATRVNGLKLQYRLGESGDFIDIDGSLYSSNEAGLGAEESFSLALPAEAIEQPIVQLRWLYYYISGSGSRDRIKLDDVIVSLEDATGLVPVTFRVDVSQFTGTISPTGMHIAGSFIENPWEPEPRPMTDEGNGVWSYTELLESGTTLDYKFVRGSSWLDGDESVAGLPCATPGDGNRQLVIPDEATTLPLVCIDSCDPCQTNPETVSVTFRVDMSNEIVNVGSGGTAISGTFNGWTFQQMTNDGNGIYSYTIQASSGSSIQYKFRNGSQVWENPPVECSVGTPPFNNRNIIVTIEDVVLPAICFGGCEACENQGNTYALTFMVDASEIETIDPAGIHIAGNFNSFSPVPMDDAGSGIYTFTASIAEGSTVLWKYLNGSSFDNVEIVPEACGQDDGFEGFNRVYTMPSAISVLDDVCFGSCESCLGQMETYTLVFQVDAANIPVIDPSGLYIAGSFNAWNPVQMESAGGALFSASIQVEAGTQVLWKYLNGSSFDGAEIVPAECGLDDGFGGYNRQFTMPDQITVQDAVCFSACIACIPDGVFSASANAVIIRPFPNPAKGSVSLEMPATGYTVIRIFDLSGKLVSEHSLSARQGETLAEIAIPELPGLYILELNVDGKMFRSKLLAR